MARMTEQENEYNQYLYYTKELLRGGSQWDFTKKEQNTLYKEIEILTRMQSMTKYKKLPDTIRKIDAENLFLTDGYGTVIKENDKIYILRGSLCGPLTGNYQPTKVLISNPWLKINKEYTIGKDCVVIQNDSSRMGILPIVKKYCTMMSENELSIWTASVMTRLFSIIVADDDKKKAAADKFLKDIQDGKLSAILSETSTQDKLLGTNSGGIGIETQPYGNSGSVGAIKSMIELQQYLKAMMYIDLGINSNFNMKREALNSEESGLNEDALFPLVDDMIENRKEGWKQANEMFGMNVEVELSSAWEDNQTEVDLKHGEMEEEDKQIEDDNKEVEEEVKEDEEDK